MRLTHEPHADGSWTTTAQLRKNGICYVARQSGPTRHAASWAAVALLGWGDTDLYRKLTRDSVAYMEAR